MSPRAGDAARESLHFGLVGGESLGGEVGGEEKPEGEVGSREAG